MKKFLSILFNILFGISFSQKKIDYNLDVMPFVKITDFRKEVETVNIYNRVAELDNYNLGLYLRPNFKFDYKFVSTSISPRLNFDYGNYKESVNAEFYFQDLKLKINVLNNLSFHAGRYVKELGTSMFINPSNPFFLNTGRFNPKIELKPMDFIDFNYSPSPNLKLSLSANISKGEEKDVYKDNFFKFKKSIAFIGEHYGNSYHLGANFQLQENSKTKHFGLYLQKNINEALVVWADAGVKYKPNRFYPVKGHSLDLLNYEMVNGDKNDKLYLVGLMGGSYTFKSGPTFYMEYFHNGMGYNEQEIKTYKELINDSKNYNFDATMLLSKLNLGRILKNSMLYSRKNYVFIQLNQNDFFKGAVNYSFRYFYCFDDSSSSLSALLEFNILSYMQLYVIGVANSGNRYSDLRKLINNQIMGGITLNL